MLRGLARITDAASGRVSSFDRSGGNRDHAEVGPRQKLVLAEIEGPGAITHLWITVSSEDPLARRSLVLRMYWDGQEHPSVESPLGDFFGQGWGMKYPFASLPLAAAPREGNALVCYFEMPFLHSARLEIENQSDVPCGAIYYYVDFERRTVGTDEG